VFGGRGGLGWSWAWGTQGNPTFVLYHDAHCKVRPLALNKGKVVGAPTTQCTIAAAVAVQMGDS
jgi:hypothetical protein